MWGNLYRESAQLPQKRWPRRPERYNSHFASARCRVGQSGTNNRCNNTTTDVMRDIPESTNPTTLPAREPVSNSDERRTNAHSLEKTIQNNQCRKIQNAVLNPRPTLTMAHNTSPHAIKTFGLALSARLLITPLLIP